MHGICPPGGLRQRERRRTAASDATDATSSDKAQALKRFKAGLKLMQDSAYNRALAAFLASRDLYATRGNTQNAAVCLRELQRYDEALQMFEALLREFPKLPPATRAQVSKEMRQLRAKVGTVEVLVLEPGAEVLVDGRQLGTTPLSAPLRVSAGVHIVRIYKEGFAPFERRVQVEPRRNLQIDGSLEPLTRAGELRIAAAGGEEVVVEIDGAAMGSTPWRGKLSVGTHSVVLRGPDDTGTAPVAAKVTVGDVTKLTLEVMKLGGRLRVQPTPANASVAIDGVDIGRGVWTGRLPTGEHRVEVAAEGFLPKSQAIRLDEGCAPAADLRARTRPRRADVVEAVAFAGGVEPHRERCAGAGIWRRSGGHLPRRLQRIAGRWRQSLAARWLSVRHRDRVDPRFRRVGAQQGFRTAIRGVDTGRPRTEPRQRG